MRLIGANEANAIAKESSGIHITEEIMKRIVKAAENGKFRLEVRDFGFGDSELYSGEMNDKQRKSVNKLKELGYKTTIRTEEKQFVDIYLEVIW